MQTSNYCVALPNLPRKKGFLKKFILFYGFLQGYGLPHPLLDVAGNEKNLKLDSL